MFFFEKKNQKTFTTAMRGAATPCFSRRTPQVVKVFCFFFSKKKSYPFLLLLAAAGPRYTPAGELIPPADYREWVFLGSGLDMSYTASPAMAGMSMFDNVFAEPSAWQAFKHNGHWPDQTMLVMEVRGADSHGSINKHGQFQADQMGAEIHVRDQARFKGGWGFFFLDGAGPAKLIDYGAGCYACHQKNAAVDTTFVQFYPTAKSIAMSLGTYPKLPEP
jgi:hypothetical protein